MSAVFARTPDGAAVATALARGPWDPGEAHGGAPAALLAGAIEALDDGEMATSRLALDFLGAVPLDVPLHVDVAVRKPGRRFQLVDAVLQGGGRELVRAQAVRLRRARQDVAPAGGPAPPPGRDTFSEHPGLVLDPAAAPTGFFPDATEIRVVDGAPGTGAATAWLRLRVPITAGAAPTPVQRAVAAADFANGLSFSVPFADWIFVNCDLTVHLSRDPVGEWIAMAARTELGDAGAGLAAGTLFDAHGPVGTVAQSLFVQRR